MLVVYVLDVLGNLCGLCYPGQHLGRLAVTRTRGRSVTLKGGKKKKNIYIYIMATFDCCYDMCKFMYCLHVTLGI